ncbi:hypothetical protein B0T24DRAFT_99711 [Lasiosphaeria ovina]|uniref:Uncharacterized protein n=1 Tax=Lasiosphaeria ovina TaxID=92902 RepID=A0AAE0JUG9_9PEZI|nr:hypothetical protein B0T24DRAFT_99711 [Lasiosphaeria ovina]
MFASARLSALLGFLAVLLSLPTPAFAFRWVNNVNFTSCYNDVVQNMTQNCSDTATQYCDYDNGVLNNPNRIFLTFQGCERLCGDGYGTWAISDILLRITLWVTPAIILLAHYHFPPLGPGNYGAVMVHILGDPIDTLWCLLIRITVRRRLFLKAQQYKLLSAGAIATIWSAYDELKFHDDPHEHFRRALTRLRTEEFVVTRSAPTSGHQVGDRVRLPAGFLQVPPDRGMGMFGTSRSLDADKTFFARIDAYFVFLLQSLVFSLTGRGRRPDTTDDVGGLPNYFQEWHRAIRELGEDERPVLYHIELAAQRLVFNRDESQTTTWISIVGLASALMGAFVRTWTNRLETQTSHTIATVALLLFVVPIIKLSGSLGAFTSSSAAANIIQELRQELQEHFGFDDGLFPPLRIPILPDTMEPGRRRYSRVGDSDDVPLTHFSGGSSNGGGGADAVPLLRSELSDDDKQLIDWPKVAAYSGMNNSYRPQKSTKLIPARVSLLLFVVSFFWVAALCYTPALLISYMTPLRGFACRSLAWTVVASCWLVNTGINYVCALTLFPYDARNEHHPIEARHQTAWTARRELLLWRTTWMRDALFTGFITLIIVAQQLGLYNSCWCRSGELSRLTRDTPSYVNLTPFTNEEWISGWFLWVPTPFTAYLLSIAGILLVEIKFSKSSSMMGKSNKEREKMLLHLRMLDTSRARQPPTEQATQQATQQAAGAAGNVSHYYEAQAIPVAAQPGINVPVFRYS